MRKLDHPWQSEERFPSVRPCEFDRAKRDVRAHAHRAVDRILQSIECRLRSEIEEFRHVSSPLPPPPPPPPVALEVLGFAGVVIVIPACDSETCPSADCAIAPDAIGVVPGWKTSRTRAA